jgi:hypothetical protein
LIKTLYERDTTVVTKEGQHPPTQKESTLHINTSVHHCFKLSRAITIVGECFKVMRNAIGSPTSCHTRSSSAHIPSKAVLDFGLQFTHPKMSDEIQHDEKGECG